MLKETAEMKERPFFATVAFTAPHDPRTPPADYLKLYTAEAIPTPPSFMPQHPFDDGYFWIRDEKLLPRPRRLGAVKREVAAYYGMISQLDAQIGRILKTLEETGQKENTIVFYLGDHGLSVGNHGLVGKMSMYAHSVQTPLIMAGPGIPKGEVTDALVYLHDLYPTSCRLVGAEVPPSVEGKDLTPIIRGDAKKVRDYIFCANANLQRMVRDSRYKLIRYYRDETRQVGSNRYCLFDLEQDPFELHDLIDDANQQDRIAKLKQQLAQWQLDHKDPYR